MKITVVAPGRIKEPWLRDGIAMYVRRLSRYTQVDIIEVADAPDTLPRPQALAREEQAIVARLPRQGYVVALDLRGDQLTSEDFAARLAGWFESGQSHVVFLIGGSHGLSPALLKRANRRLSLSPATFTHQMARLILLEQCYRAFRINRGEPYHK